MIHTENVTTLVSIVGIITGSLLIGHCWEFSDLVRILAILTAPQHLIKPKCLYQIDIFPLSRAYIHMSQLFIIFIITTFKWPGRPCYRNQTSGGQTGTLSIPVISLQRTLLHCKLCTLCTIVYTALYFLSLHLCTFLRCTNWTICQANFATLQRNTWCHEALEGDQWAVSSEQWAG